VQPQSAEDVALAVRIIAETHSGGDNDKCIFAVKSGGHGMFAGASNAPGDVTIDLRYLDDVSVAEDRKTVTLGLGNK
jgi:FAD/FMN-containing dehydrogenase